MYMYLLSAVHDILQFDCRLIEYVNILRFDLIDWYLENSLLNVFSWKGMVVLL